MEIVSSNLPVFRFSICVKITAGVMTPEVESSNLDDTASPIVSQNHTVISRYHPVSPDNLIL